MKLDVLQQRDKNTPLLDGKISVIMPAYNEAEYIEQNAREVANTLFDFGYDFEVIIVDDGSPDNTYRRAVLAVAEHPEHVRVLRYDKNEGKGNALTCGSLYARGEYIVFLDADMDLHPVQLPVLFEIMRERCADVVVGSKHHPLSAVQYPPIRRLYSVCYYLLVRALFGLPLRDTQTGLKVFRSAVLRSVLPRLLAKRFAFDIELLANAHRQGFVLVDAPVTLNFQRTLGRIRFKDVLAVLTDTLAIFYRMRILRYYDRREIKERTLSFESAREIRETNL